MITQDLGIATAYGYAKSKGYTGTEAEFAELMASYAEVGQTAVDAAETATTKANEASASATTARTAANTATTKAGEASQSASTATNAASAAQADADAAALDASQAMSAASTATTKAEEAATSATTATNAKDAAVTAKTAAQAAQTAAETAEDNAEASASAAAASAASVQSSAEQITQNATDINELKNTLSDLQFKSGLYGAKWDRTTNLLTRTRDAVGITTDTTNFVHKGSINPNYSNPFDQIYPWSEMKVVDIDLDMYRSGNYTLKQCIIAVAGDPDFTYEGSDKVFVGRYVPEFWHAKIADESGDEYLVSQFARKGYKHVDEYVRGISFAIDDGNGGVTSGADIPLTNIAVSAIHTRAKNSGFTIMDIDTLDAEIMLYLVEFANMNSQNALGDGCSSCYRENDVDAISNVVVGDGVTTFDITDSAEVQYMHIGTQMDIGATRGAVTYRGIIKAFEIDGSTEHITLDRELAVTDGMIASIHGFSACEFNLTDANVGSMSGYIGTNSKNNAWYRGALLYANRYSYILGIYRQQNTNHIWACPDGVDPNDYDALNTNVHKDTETALPILEAVAWQTVGANAQNIDGLSAFMATGVSSGSSESPVGDQQYVPVASTGNTILLFGCSAYGGWICGVFGGHWLYSSGASHWNYVALPVLKKLL